MFFLIALIAAALAWFVGRGLFARTALPTPDILYADVGSTLPQPAPLISKRYRLSGKPDYLVRVKDGIAPVELKSSRSPSSGRPYDGRTDLRWTRDRSVNGSSKITGRDAAHVQSVYIWVIGRLVEGRYQIGVHPA